jgi:ADP-heptose:LPS heptosyltransferase
MLNPVLPRPSQPMHTVEWNHTVINHLGDFPMPMKPILPDVGAERDAKLVTISVSAGAAEKAYPLSQWEVVASQLMAEGFHVTFLGGRTDPHPAVGKDLVGKLRLKDTLRLVASSAIHLAADTGTGHMAAAVGTPVVSVFGPTDPTRFRPYSDNATVLHAGSRTGDVSATSILDSARAVLGRQVGLGEAIHG